MMQYDHLGPRTARQCHGALSRCAAADGSLMTPSRSRRRACVVDTPVLLSTSLDEVMSAPSFGDRAVKVVEKVEGLVASGAWPCVARTCPVSECENLTFGFLSNVAQQVRVSPPLPRPHCATAGFRS